MSSAPAPLTWSEIRTHGGAGTRLYVVRAKAPADLGRTVVQIRDDGTTACTTSLAAATAAASCTCRRGPNCLYLTALDALVQAGALPDPRACGEQDVRSTEVV